MAIAAAGTLGVFFFARPQPELAAAIHFEVLPPAGTELAPNVVPFPALSPDGRRVAFVVFNSTQEAPSRVRRKYNGSVGVAE